MKNANKTSQNITPPPHAKNVNNSNIFSHIKSYFKNLKRSKNNVEHGRSMVEMLGVLAIIGVLSIGAIAGYTVAMNRHKANQIFDSATKLSVAAQTGTLIQSRNWQGPVQDMFRQIGGTLYSQDAHAVAGGVYEATLEVFENGMVLGWAQINGVQAALNSLSGRDDHVLIGGDIVSGSGTNTPSEPSEPSNPSEPVTDAPNYPVTEPVTQTQTQTEGCPSNYFMGNDGKCYACSTSSRVLGAFECENKCPNRVLNADYCALPCTSGYFMGVDAKCYSCYTSSNVQVDMAQNTGQCSRCSNRTLNSSGYCVLYFEETQTATQTATQTQPEATQTEGCPSNYFMDVMGICHSCNTSDEIDVFTDPSQCSRCSNRKLDNVNGTICMLK